jgi:hypothetical protein
MKSIDITKHGEFVKSLRCLVERKRTMPYSVLVLKKYCLDGDTTIRFVLNQINAFN